MDIEKPILLTLEREVSLGAFLLELLEARGLRATRIPPKGSDAIDLPCNGEDLDAVAAVLCLTYSQRKKRRGKRASPEVAENLLQWVQRTQLLLEEGVPHLAFRAFEQGVGLLRPTTSKEDAFALARRIDPLREAIAGLGDDARANLVALERVLAPFGMWAESQGGSILAFVAKAIQRVRFAREDLEKQASSDASASLHARRRPPAP